MPFLNFVKKGFLGVEDTIYHVYILNPDYELEFVMKTNA